MENKSFWCINLSGVLTGLILIPVLFYTYNGAFGKSPSWLNIVFFYFTATMVFLLEIQLLKIHALRCRHPWIAFAIIYLIGVFFTTFTFITPHIPLFQNPLNGTT